MKGPSQKLPLYQHAAERKVKLFSTKEIGEAQGLEKIRRKVWNEKAEELRQERALKKWKAIAIHGVRDNAFAKKSVVLVVEADNTQDSEARKDVTECSMNKKQKKRNSGHKHTVSK